jgi:FkbM family methyltransferase
VSAPLKRGRPRQVLSSVFQALRRSVDAISRSGPFKMDSALLHSKMEMIDRKLDRLLNELEFIKNRTNAYLGERVGLTYLIDETPIYINTNDYGCPSNFLNGGRYEEDYIAILASFRTPRSVFLDVGANLGVFSLRLAPMMRHGKIFAFEPNPKIRSLLDRSVFLSGWEGKIEVCGIGLSDVDTTLQFSVPIGHAGGGFVGTGAENTERLSIQVRRLDEWLPSEFIPDIIKLDVEGHELNALRGMRKTLSRSKNLAILFEKLSLNAGVEDEIVEITADLELALYRADGTHLQSVSPSEFKASAGYFLATREEQVTDQLDRHFIVIYPSDLIVLHGYINQDTYRVDTKLTSNDILFYGPYWYLRRGTYSCEIDGEIHTAVKICITERFGYPVFSFELSQAAKHFVFPVHRDLMQFEVVARCLGSSANIRLDKIRLTRVG